MTKPPLLLLPGTLCDERLFVRQRLAMRGIAQVQVASFQRLKSWNAWFDDLLHRLPERFAVAGFSLGGLLALELLRRAPERISHVALIASNALATSPVAKRRSAAMRKLWQRRGSAAVIQKALPAYFHHARQRQRHAGLLHRMAAATPTSAALQEFNWAANRPAGYAALKAFTGPVLIASGAHDGVCPRHLQKALVAAQPNAIWHEFPHSGHFVPLEASSQLSHALKRWLISSNTSHNLRTNHVD